MMFAGRPRAFAQIAPLLAAFALGGCGSGDDNPYAELEYLDPQEIPPCDKSIEIKGDSNALMVTDPEILSKLQLKDVMQQFLASENDTVTTPVQLMQQMFDTNNSQQTAKYNDVFLCDSPENPAHINGLAPTCPRKEGSLASSTGFFTQGDPDYFYPVAAVNRMDLMPFTAETCGELRIIYAKKSGLTDPNNRVFLIFEMSVSNPQTSDGSAPTLFGCRPVAELWKGMQDETDKTVLADKLRSFFFEGTIAGGKLVTPPIDSQSLGFGSSGGASYYGARGQLRVSQHMDDFWEMRQMVTNSSSSFTLRFDPVTLGNNPLPSRFESIYDDAIEHEFADDFALNSVDSLASKDLSRMTMTVRVQDLGGESELGGEAVNDYAARGAGNQYLHDVITKRIAARAIGADCPADDPLTSESILRRATIDSCAGCHAPSQFLGPERKIGCGLTWPDSLGEVHINEKGERSPALTEVFLPHRAEVMTTYLQACNADDINAAFGGPSSGTSTKSANRRRTIGGSSTH